MEISRVWAVYFSPTGGTRQVVCTVAEALGAALGCPVAALDLTPPAARRESYRFAPGELVVLGTPVYAGRVPNKLLPDLEARLAGGGACAVPVSVYGNRDFGDALMELKLLAEKQGFFPVAAAAAVSRHAFTDALAPGRPDAADREALRAFAARVARRVAAGSPPWPLAVPGSDPVGPYYTPLQQDGTPARFLKAKPVTDTQRCTGCGACAAACPMGSIDAADCTAVPGVCIKCQACIRTCPQGAKHFEDAQFLSHVRMLEQHYARPAEYRFFGA